MYKICQNIRINIDLSLDSMQIYDNILSVFVYIKC